MPPCLFAGRISPGRRGVVRGMPFGIRQSAHTRTAAADQQPGWTVVIAGSQHAGFCQTSELKISAVKRFNLVQNLI